MSQHPVVPRAEWLEARKLHLEREKALEREREALSEERRALPWASVEDYVFAGESGPVRLSELFAGKSQLIVQHFMFGADWEAGCPSCSFWADGFDRAAVHLASRDARFVAISIAPLERLLAYRARMGWRFPWVSSAGTSFNRDFGVSFESVEEGASGYNFATTKAGAGEYPGLSVFALDAERIEGPVFHTYSTYARGLDRLNVAYQLLDLLPRGRDEEGLPWPQAWVRRHDEYA